MPLHDSRSSHLLDVSRSERPREPEPETEFRIRIEDAWSRRLFIGISRHHGVKPYRYRGQRRTTVVFRAGRSVVDRVILPHYHEAVAAMREHFDAIAERVIAEALHVSSDDVEERVEPIRAALEENNLDTAPSDSCPAPRSPSTNARAATESITELRQRLERQFGARVTRLTDTQLRDFAASVDEIRRLAQEESVYAPHLFQGKL